MEEKNLQKKEDLDFLSARIPTDLRDAFWETKPKGVIKQHVMSAAARLWIQLPESLRKELTDAESKIDTNPDLANQSFVLAVQRIAEKVYEQKSKPVHKGSQKK